MSFDEENLLLELDSENEDFNGPISANSNDYANKKHQNFNFTQRLAESNQLLRGREAEQSYSTSFKLVKRPGSPSIFTEQTTRLRIQDKSFASQDFSKLIHHRIIPISKLKSLVKGGEIQSDFVIIAAIYEKTALKTSVNGSKYIMLKITDLKSKMNLFLFNNALAKFENESVSTSKVIALLNPVRSTF